jgi:protoporphyrinogen oxidase
MAVTAEITTNPGDGIHELTDDKIIHHVVDGLTAMKLIDPARIRFRSIHRTKHAYVVRTFDYAEKLKAGLAYLDSLDIVSAGRNAEFEYINMDEAIRRGLEVARQLDAD